MNNKKVISFDIDGVLNSYPECWLKYVNKNTKRNFSSKTEAKKKLGIAKYNFLKHKYRLSDYKYSLPVEKNIIILIKKLKKRYKLIILTTRPFKKYPKMKLKTKKWLIKKKILFDELHSKNEFILKKYPKILFHVDDELNDCKIFLKRKIKCFLLTKKDSKKKVKFITRIKSLDYLSNYL
jgi:hypothetical protein